MTALMRAARDGDRAEASRLIGRGANVNAAVPTRDLRELIAFLSWMQQLPSSDIGFTPLMYAAQSGHGEMARMLIGKGADARHAARGGTTALDLAIHRSDTSMMRVLVPAVGRPGARQFALAVALSRPEAVRFLLEHGADANAVARAAPRRTGPPPAPPIIIAARRGDPDVLALLVGAGARLHVTDENGWTALRWAKHGNVRDADRRDRLVAILEGSGARDAAGESAAALFDAVLRRDVAAVRAALGAGANPNARDDRGVPPLIYAAHHGQAEIMAALIEAGANVNVSPRNDDTPLIAAITGGSIEGVKMLLAAGARADQPDHIRRTPLQVASGWKRTEITALLLSATGAAKDEGALAIAALGGSVEQVRMLLAAGADPKAGGGHALSEAARGCLGRDNTDVIRLLLEAGAVPRAPGGGEYTALHRAAALCPPDAVRLLLARGADPNARDVSEVTPLISAASAGMLDNVRLLIAAGARVDARDGEGKAALDHAARHPEVQQELRGAGARP